MPFVHYIPGGGLGDVFREAYWHNAVGILKRWKLLNPTERLKVVCMSHNPSVADLFVGQDWIDELKVLRFPLEKTWDWEACYKEYRAEFEGQTELRFNVADRRSLYRADMAMLRPKIGQVQTIQPIGTAWDFAYPTHYPQGIDFVVHPYAGQQRRCWSPALRGDVIAMASLAGFSHHTVAANYQRPEHGEEVARSEPLLPRQLIQTIRHARGVIATESSVYYIASMLGVPVAMLYAQDETYHRVITGRSDWDWFFGANDPKNLFLQYPLGQNTPRLAAWISRTGGAE